MPFKCCVPGCRGNYKNGPKVHVFGFPYNSVLKEKWIFAIPRDGLVPNKNTKVCELHFTADSIIWISSAQDPQTGKVISVDLKKPRLLENCIPSIFPSPLDVGQAHSSRARRGVTGNNNLTNSLNTGRMESNIHCEGESSPKYESQLQYSDPPEIITKIKLETPDTREVDQNFEEQAMEIKQEAIEMGCNDFLSNVPVKTENLGRMASIEEGNSGRLFEDFMIKNEELYIKNEEDINERSYNPSMAAPVKTENHELTAIEKQNMNRLLQALPNNHEEVDIKIEDDINMSSYNPSMAVPVKTGNHELTSIEEQNMNRLLQALPNKHEDVDVKIEEGISMSSYNPSMAVPIKTGNHELTAIEEQNMNRLLQALPNKHEEVDIKIEEDISMSRCDSLSEVTTKSENIVTMASIEERNSGRLLMDFIKKEIDLNESSYDNLLMAVPVRTENHETTAIEVQNMNRLLEDLPNRNEEMDYKFEEKINITGSSCVKIENRLLPNHTISNQGSFTTSRSPDNILRCNECSYETKLVAYFKKHLCRPKNKTQYRCNQRNYESTDKQVIKQHKCDQCPYQSGYKSNLNRHILVHRSRNEVKMYRCEKCNFQTKDKNKVRRHFGHKLFLADDRYVCKECELYVGPRERRF